MARTKTVIVNDVEYQLQSVNFTWYSNLTDLYINPANGRKNTAKYADALIKGCVTAPAEVAKAGLKYFDEQDDLATPGELVREIESFLANELNRKESRARKTSGFGGSVFCMGGVTYSELKEMDLYEFSETEQARLLWQDEWNKKD